MRSHFLRPPRSLSLQILHGPGGEGTLRHFLPLTERLLPASRLWPLHHVIQWRRVAQASPQSLLGIVVPAPGCDAINSASIAPFGVNTTRRVCPRLQQDLTGCRSESPVSQPTVGLIIWNLIHSPAIIIYNLKNNAPTTVLNYEYVRIRLYRKDQCIVGFVVHRAH
ncbi:hypothetical protein chiPu_0027300 [Chiloscyllium punctatum]|uniref:Uncharacterized protein n=1 Tax=Chiloscyllium punctatum TaxID=137246 RepID=A0A401TLC3_CHIPU|nr:hypothetical protein [Chiloscyllium punctatum]